MTTNTETMETQEPTIPETTTELETVKDAPPEPPQYSRKVVIEKRFNFDTHGYDDVIKIKIGDQISEIPYVHYADISTRFNPEEIQKINNCNLSLLNNGYSGLNEDEQAFLIDPEAFMSITQLQHLSGIK